MVSHLTATAPVWIFDLDNTLHDAMPHVFPHINRSMTAYLQEHLALDETDAARLRVSYWRRYGATLLGLMRHHGTDPHHFLWHTHQFPDLSGMLVFERGLNAMLRRLPGRKLVFSNAPSHYAEAVLGLMGIRPRFDAVFSIEHTRFRPKPGVAGFHRLLRAFRLPPARCVMVEDSVENLVTARRLGMSTVLVARRAAPRWVDARVNNILTLPRVLQRLGVHRTQERNPHGPSR